MLMVPTRAPAMELKIVGNQLILSGPVVGDEPDKVREALASSPGIKIVILRNSGGGNAPAGYQVGQLLRERGLRTAVSGYCYSSCSRMFLGGSARYFTDDYMPECMPVILLTANMVAANPDAVPKNIRRDTPALSA